MRNENPINMRLKLAIVASGQSQRDLSLKTGIGEVRLSGIVHGRRDPTAEERRELARVLRLPQRKLFATAAPATQEATG